MIPEGGVLTWTDFGARQPSFIVSFVPASCPPSSPTRIATPEKRILQLFHPLFHFYPEEKIPIPFSDDNHNLFVERMSSRHIQLYNKIYGDTPNFSWMWLGIEGKF